MGSKRSSRVFVIFFLAVLVFAARADAHGFGKKIDLPLPFSFYLLGAALAVGVSFVLLGSSTGSQESTRDLVSRILRSLVGWRISLPEYRLPLLVSSVRLLALAFWIFLTVAGFLGNAEPTRNILPLCAWVYFGVGGVLLAATVGNAWPLLHPMGVLYDWIIPAESRQERRCRRWALWFALLGFLLYRIVENVMPNPADPRLLSSLVLIYSGVSLAGMVLVGKHSWLSYGDPFGVFFRLLSRCAVWEATVKTREFCRDCPLECSRVTEGNECRNCPWCFAKAPPAFRRRSLRPWGAELFSPTSASLGEIAFVAAMLSTLAFDGLKYTQWWVRLHVGLNIRSFGSQFAIEVGTLVALLLLYLLIYFAVAWGAGFASGVKGRMASHASNFALSLLPISVAYEAAHYATLLLVDGQGIIPIVSDPLGMGWNLFGTAGYRINYQIVNFLLLWDLQTALIVVGHMIAIASSHIIALEIFPSRGAAVRSQIPMLFLMVGYTMFSLWLLAQPLAIGA